MTAPEVRFNKKDRPEFFRILNARVNQHFKDTNRSRYANRTMFVKTAFMLALYFIPLAILLSGLITSYWQMMLVWITMGFGMSGIGLAVMHDANHGAYSKSKGVNRFMGFMINFIGGYHVNWKIQHNVLHHSFTNIHECDDDINKGIIRLSPDQEHKNMYRFQIIYAPVLYSLLSIFWLLAKDLQQLVRYNGMGLIQKQGLSFKSALGQIVFHKVWYVLLTLVLPILMVALPWWQVLSGFILMHLICGLFLALIFLPAHVIEETHFYKTDPEGSVENNWAIHQLKTTANFAINNRPFTWFVGGLNHQIEHHLFPNICHVHYQDLSVIVKQTAKEFDIHYYEHPTFYGAVKSHFGLLHRLGTGSYDRELASV